jgi:diguanylate cyclase (GGDEF)-like protein
MISLKKYLDGAQTGPEILHEHDGRELLPVAMAAYRSALMEMGNCSLDACPALGDELKRGLRKLGASLSAQMSCEAVEATDRGVQEELRGWGRSTALHYRQTTGEVKELLIVMARTAESVGERDQRCAGQINEVTDRLKKVACLEDLTEIRASIQQSAAELKSSIDRMAAEGKAAVEQLQKEVTTYRTKLEEAEEIASRDALTGLRSRLCVENQIENRIAAGHPLCVAIIDIDGFKRVNDDHGHLIGDELLKQFATELTSACRSTDVIGRWGGDEFIILLDSGMTEAKTHIDRLREWVCGNYTVQGTSGSRNLTVSASIGLAEHMPNETMKELLDRADAEMYRFKTASRAMEAGPKQ